MDHSSYSSLRPPASPHQRKRRNSNLSKILAIAFTLTIFVVVNTCFTSTAVIHHRHLQMTFRKLCKTFFPFKDWDSIWEELYPAQDLREAYIDLGEVAKVEPFDLFNIAYILTLITCPSDTSYQPGVDSQFDPGHGFYDAAAMLKYSVYHNTYPRGSKYNATMYAIVHPEAINCAAPNGKEYDRVRVLQDLGYRVVIFGNPLIRRKNMNDPFLLANIDNDVGEREMIKLWAMIFSQYPAVVLMDFTALMLNPIDHVFETIQKTPSIQMYGSLDYPTTLPAQEGRNGVNMHFLILKPDPDLKDAIEQSYLTTPIDPIWGWNAQGVRDFPGYLGPKGFLYHYFSRVESGKYSLLSRCIYGNDASPPTATDPSTGEQIPRDPSDPSDCRTAVPFEQIHVAKMLPTCGMPWDCSYNDTWDAPTKAICEYFLSSWFTMRDDFERDCWDGPKAAKTGTFHPEIFKGYCSSQGPEGYEHLVSDKP